MIDKANMKTSQWSLETIAREKYRLVQVLSGLGREEEACKLEDELRRIYAKLMAGDMAGFPELASRSIEVFDGMVSIYFGRSTGELYHVPP